MFSTRAKNLFFITLLLPLLPIMGIQSFMPRLAVVFGVFRSIRNTELGSESEFTVIQNTPECEDMHFHQESGLIFAAAEAYAGSRFSWWPILNNFDGYNSNRQGSIKIIDPKTLTARTLRLENFSTPFLTHGMDVVNDPALPPGTAIYILIINHLPYINHHQTSQGDADQGRRKCGSVVEVFHHTIGSDVAVHIRTVQHPLINTPNDLVALSPTSFLITNDHQRREGYLKLLEDVYWLNSKANVVHVTFTLPAEHGKALEQNGRVGVSASIAMPNVHSANGIGHGRTKDEVIISSAASGTARLGKLFTDASGNVSIEQTDSIQFESLLDNPTYFRDPFADKNYDASSFILAGLAKGAKIVFNMRSPKGNDPSVVWRLTPADAMITTTKTGSSKQARQWKVDKVFEDDGKRIRSSSMALVVAIDPRTNQGKRQGWLFITGFYSPNMVAFKIDL